jgi:AraC family transcriptional regulator, activator of mtrCDE
VGAVAGRPRGTSAEGAAGWYSSIARALSAITSRAKAVNAIFNDPAHDWTLDALALRAHVSRATLVRAFKKAAGMAPLAFVAEVRLNLARQSLASTTASALQVATAVGYASESAFFRAFKRRFGISPGKIRPR